jgi:hypothetical protein
MDIAVRAGKTYTNENQTWIGGGGISALRDLRTITLDRSTINFTKFPAGVLPSGITLGRITTAIAGGGDVGLYTLYDNAFDADTATAGQQSDGRDVAVGFLAVTLAVDPSSTGDLVGALYWHGEVVEANLPTNHGLDAAGKTDLAAKFAFI